jgi:hypothetical protein
MFRFILLATVVSVSVRNEFPVDVIEFNHCKQLYNGAEYKQIILWTWDPEYRRYDVSGWFLAEKSYPVRWRGDMWIAEHISASHGIVFFKSKVFRQTWTRLDPERLNQKYRKEDQRVMILERSTPTVAP